MKLGNRKVVRGGMTAAALAMITALAPMIPATTSATNFATISYQPSSMVLSAISATSSNALGLGAGVAKVLTQEMDNQVSDSGNEDIADNSEQEESKESSESSNDSEEEQSEEEEADTASEWDTKVMPKVEDALNIRATPDEDGELIGKLYKGSAATVLEVDESGWTKITSGSVTEGYVKNDYIAVGEEAKEIAERDGKLVATITTETIHVRSEASEDASVVDLAAEGDQYTAITENDGWVEIEFEGQPAYVSAEYTSVELVLGEAITIEEELAAQKAEEEAKAAAEKAKAAAETETDKKESSTTEKSAVSASTDDTMLLAALVQMEAGGESYEGKVAVASVVMNRVRSGGYPSSISGVIYQSGQFPGAASGKLASILASGSSSSCQQAASEALAGTDNVGGLTHFISVRSANYEAYGSYTVIGNHCFY